MTFTPPEADSVITTCSRSALAPPCRSGRASQGGVQGGADLTARPALWPGNDSPYGHAMPQRIIHLNTDVVAKGVEHALCRFRDEVLIARGLIPRRVMNERPIVAEVEASASRWAANWQELFISFKPDEPTDAASIIASGLLDHIVVDAINCFCREVLVPNGHMSDEAWGSRELDAPKYAIASEEASSWTEAICRVERPDGIDGT